MKPFLLVLFVTTLSLARAQFAEPKTAAEDPVQRLFPIEAARVLAWQRNLNGAGIEDVKWSVESTAGVSAWKIAWVDAAGKTMRECAIKTGAAQLAAGADYYREVFKQLAGIDWAEQSAPPDNAATAFWQGADLSGANRPEALSAAAKLLADQPNLATPATAARVAGVMVHAALPSLAGTRPLDPVLVARGAAWLCVAERRLREPIEPAWGPVLFLAGRETDASQKWQQRKGKSKLKSGAERFWNLALRDPKPADAFAYAARKENKAWALPALFLLVRRDDRLRAPAQEIAPMVSADYPLTEKAGAASSDVWKRIAAEYPTTKSALVPIAIATRREIELSAVKVAKRERAGGLADLTDEAVAQLAQNAVASADQPAPVSDSRGGAPMPPPDFTNADAAWAYVMKLENLDRQPDSPEDAQRVWKLRYQQRRDAAEKFASTFPADPRRWDAAIVAYDCARDLVRMGDRDAKKPSPDVLEAVLAAPDATEQAKGDAAFYQALLVGDEASVNAPHTLPPFHRALSEFIARYPNHPKAPIAASYQLQLLNALETPGADKILSGLAAHPNPAIAAQAKSLLEQRTRILEFKKQPIDLKFTAADGRAVDLGQMRGKIVLLDFWASWCGPCMSEAPQVLATYQKFRDRGFEIIGINLDEDKKAMEAAAKRVGMTWPQHFDGKGWQNEIATRFGIRSIPATWLFDGQGKLREVGLRGAELEAGIERLLRKE